MSWEAFRPASCMPDACFCEAVADGWLRQPANAISSLAFCVVGLALVWRSRMRPSAPTLLFAVAAFLVGAGSFVYHASLTFWGQFVDVASMYLLVSCPLLANAAALERWSPKQLAGAYLLGHALLAAGLIALPELRRYVFAALIAAALASEWALRRAWGARASLTSAERRQVRWLVAAAAALGVAAVVWALDLTRTLCDPHSWLQGHAVWHVLGALAVALAYRYYETAPTVAPGMGRQRPATSSNELAS